MADDGSRFQDVGESQAFIILDELAEDDLLKDPDVSNLKEDYSKIHNAVVEKYGEMEVLNKSVKELSQALLSEKIQLERFNITKLEEDKVTAQLFAEKEAAKLAYQNAQEEQTNVQFSQKETIQEKNIIERRVERMREENKRMIEPQRLQYTEEIAELEEDLKSKVEESEKENKKCESLAQQILDTKAQNSQLLTEEERLKKVQRKIKADPGRIIKQGDIVLTAVQQNEKDIARLKLLLGPDSVNAKERSLQITQDRELDEKKQEVLLKIERYKVSISKRERELDLLMKNIHQAQLEEADHRQVAVRLNIREEEISDTIKHRLSEVSKAHKDFDKSKRQLKLSQAKCDTVVASVPNLRMQIQDLKHSLQRARDETKKQEKAGEGIRADADVLEQQFLARQAQHKVKTKKLEGLIAKRRELEAELEQWKIEKSEMAKTSTMLSAQRDMKARDLSKATKSHKKVLNEIRIKKLRIADARKTAATSETRLREYNQLYEVVKNERNRYVALTQESMQAQAEMREKIKILENEVEILRNESLAKDAALAKEALVQQQSCNTRDQLRLETNKSHAIYRQKQEQVEQQIVEIEKLNSVINQLESEMLQLKHQYELAVENRNFMGLQLIERNDELCILYERANVQEATLKKGSVKLTTREAELRMLKLELKEANRQIEVSKKLLPQLPKLRKKIEVLKKQLHEERARAETLSYKLETPANSDRWHELEGEDPDTEQLLAKIAVLEERLAEKKEDLLERELVHEEVSTLSTKLKAQATDGRQDTLKLAKKVNDFQARIREMSRKMMAVVSELSMYQATSLKLEAELGRQQETYDMARANLDSGKAPTEEIERLWRRTLQMDQARREEAAFRRQEGLDDQAQGPQLVTRTTAEPRPNAYIPSDGLGLPKPYGKFAQFKPSAAGATMRHIRNPVPKEIEL